MRIISYNILDGGEGRADPLAEVIEAQQADVIALVEATDLSVIERIANRLKMDYLQGIGNSQASALLSRWTISESINHAVAQPALSKSLLEATVIDPSGASWVIGVVHLHHGAREEDEVKREGELKVLLDIFAPRRRDGVPHLIAGDFNANSPLQRIDPAKCKPSTREAWQGNGGNLPRRVINGILQSGYADSLAVHREAAGEMGTFTTQFPGQRVDYIFTHSIDGGRLRDGWVEQDRLAKYASDHFPVGLEIA